MKKLHTKHIWSTISAISVAASGYVFSFQATADDAERPVLTFSRSPSGTIQQWLDTTLQGDCGENVTVNGTYSRIVFDGVTMSVTFDGVDADNRAAAYGALPQDLSAVSVSGGSAVTIELNGNSTLQGGTDSAGLYVASDSSIVLKDQDGDGTLNAQGGQASNPRQSGSGAGIGGNWNMEVGSITIESGVIHAQGGHKAAGIGSGFDSGAQGVIICTGDITIHGGQITALGGTGDNGCGESRSAYGKGTALNEGTIRIDGGHVLASGHSGIGGGNHKNGGTITIAGHAEVEARGSFKGGAGIGSGLGSSKDKMTDAEGVSMNVSGGSITITDHAVVRAYGDYDMAGIGGGLYGDSETIVITGSSQVFAKGGYRAAGIGGGYQDDGQSIDISGTAQVRAFGGAGGKASDALCGGAGIGGGTEGGVVNEAGDRYTRGGNAIAIRMTEEADILAVGGRGASGIGSGAELCTSDAGKYAVRSIQGSITLSGDVRVRAFSDGTKWALDLVDTDVDGSGLSADNTVLQGRFRSNEVETGLTYDCKDEMVSKDTILDSNGPQPSGSYPIMNSHTTADSANRIYMTGLDLQPVEGADCRMPYNYRSFAFTGFQSEKKYDIWLLSGTYGDQAKLISGVTVGDGRDAASAESVTDAEERVISHLADRVYSADDLAFTVRDPESPEVPDTDEPEDIPEEDIPQANPSTGVSSLPALVLRPLSWLRAPCSS